MAQVPDPGTVGNPGAAQDAEAAREKILKASDQIDMIQGNYETTRVTLAAMKTDITQLQADNTELKQQIADLHAALDRSESQRVKDREEMINQVAELIATASKGSSPKPSAKRHAAPTAATEEIVPEDHSSASTEVHAPSVEPAAGAGANPVPPPTGSPDSSGAHHDTEVASNDSSLAPPVDASQPPPPPPKPQKGYYHVVEAGETLTMICSAYRDQGVKVSVSQVRKANGLTEKSVLKVGQKLFIPKSGT